MFTKLIASRNSAGFFGGPSSSRIISIPSGKKVLNPIIKSLCPSNSSFTFAMTSCVQILKEKGIVEEIYQQLNQQNHPHYKEKKETRGTGYLWVLKSFMISRNLSYLSLWSENTSFTALRYATASLLVNFGETRLPRMLRLPVTPPDIRDGPFLHSQNKMIKFNVWSMKKLGEPQKRQCDHSIHTTIYYPYALHKCFAKPSHLKRKNITNVQKLKMKD